jgi:glycosyltransferase involved in cell wall biosynthesis
MPQKIGILSNTSWSLYNFRRNLIRRLIAHGYDVVAMAPADGYSSDLADLGCKYVPIQMNNKGRNPIEDFYLFVRLVRIFRREQFACILTFTPKPNIYGCWAARLLSMPAIANIAGLGTVFAKQSLTQTLVRTMYRLALHWPVRVFFQNIDDFSLFTSRRLAPLNRADLLPGSGVDLHHYSPLPAPTRQTIVFLFFSRLLREKGIEEFVAAARALTRKQKSDVEFRILGFPGTQNPSAISMATVQRWTEEGVVNYLGEARDVRPFVADADCVVLPSYYPEGVPRTLLEAASMGKPVITTDTPGCRSVVEDGVTGFLVRARNPEDLVAKMAKMIAMPRGRRDEMGKKAREKMSREFDEEIVLRRYVGEISRAVGGP